MSPCVRYFVCDNNNVNYIKCALNHLHNQPPSPHKHTHTHLLMLAMLACTRDAAACVYRMLFLNKTIVVCNACVWTNCAHCSSPCARSANCTLVFAFAGSFTHSAMFTSQMFRADVCAPPSNVRVSESGRENSTTLGGSVCMCEYRASARVFAWWWQRTAFCVLRECLCMLCACSALSWMEHINSPPQWWSMEQHPCVCCGMLLYSLALHVLSISSVAVISLSCCVPQSNRIYWEKSGRFCFEWLSRMSMHYVMLLIWQIEHCCYGNYRFFI